MRQRLADLGRALREFVKPTWDHEDNPDLEADAAARTAWVASHRHPDGG